MGAFFASKPRAKPVGALGIFSCLTLERLPLSFYLIRDKPMVEEGGNLSNVGQAKMPKAPTSLALGLEAKNASTLVNTI